MGVSLQSVTMKSFIIASLLGTCLSAPTATHVASGEPAGPLTLAFGDAVHTPKGLRSYSLEGFSEDLDQDGFVDPIGQAVVVAPVVAPVAYTVPKVAVTVPKVAAVPAPAPVTYTVPVAAASDKDTVVPAATAPLIYSGVPVVPSVLQYQGVEAKYASEPVVGKLQYLPGFAPFTGVPFVGGLVPAAAAAPAADAAAAAPAVEAAGEGVEAV